MTLGLRPHLCCHAPIQGEPSGFSSENTALSGKPNPPCDVRIVRFNALFYAAVTGGRRCRKPPLAGFVAVTSQAFAGSAQRAAAWRPKRGKASPSGSPAVRL